MAIRHELVTGHFTLLVEDSIRDEDHQLDEVNLSGTCTFTPVPPKGVTQWKASEPNRLVSLKPIRALIADGMLISLSGTVDEIGDVPGREGQELPVQIGDQPVWWRVSFSVAWEDIPVKLPSLLVDATEGPVDLTTLLSATGFPEADMSEVEGIIATVRAMSRAAEDAIRRAEEAAELVNEVDEAARDAVRVAGESAATSVDAAERAEAGADRVGSAEDVLDARATAVQAAASASESAHEAGVSASDAASSAGAATGAASAAEGSASDAASSASSAEDSADAADSSATFASSEADRSNTAANTSRGHNDTAWTARQQSIAARDDAREARGDAEQSASDADSSAAAAASSASSASDDADRAEAAAELADGAAVEAVTERVDALLEGAPEAYDTLAEIAAKLADQDDVAEVMLEQIGQKVEKTSTAARLYGTNAGGNQTQVGYASSATANSVAYRAAGGTLQVGSPTDDAHATTKAYVDDTVPVIAVVDEHPDDPDPGTIYLVREAE